QQPTAPSAPAREAAPQPDVALREQEPRRREQEPRRREPERAPGFGDLLAAGSAVALLVFMFAMAWYGVAGVPDPSYARPAVSTTVDGWNGLTGVRWVIVATVLAAVGSLALLASRQRLPRLPIEIGAAVGGLGALTAALLVWRVLISLPGDGRVLDQKLGALLGLASALGIAWGGAEMALARRRVAAGRGPG
ncbi:MAG: hypothetical protein ACRDL5_01875, partial [Solirubrobacteraceae bacterium]